VSETEVIETEPVAVESAASESPAPVVEETASALEGEGSTDRPRDEHGRFVAKEKDAATEAAPLPGGEPGADTSLPVAAAPPAPVPEPQPFKWRADRQEHTLEGAVINPDGSLVIPAQHVARAKQLLSEGIVHQGSWAKERTTWSARINDAETRAKAAEASKARLLDEFAKVFESEDSVLQFWQSRQTQLPLLQERLKAQELEERIKAYESGQARPASPEPAADPAQTVETARAELTETLPDFFASPEYSALTDKDKQYLIEEMTQDISKYVKVANKDIPEHGFVAGDLVLFDELVHARIRREAERVGELRAASAEQAKKLAEAAKFNAARAPQKGAAPIATVPSGGKVPAPTSDPVPAYKDGSEWRSRMGLP
jgi:hypothetical protein